MSDDEDFIVDELPASRRKRRTAGGDGFTRWVLQQVGCSIRGVQSQEYSRGLHIRLHSPALGSSGAPCCSVASVDQQ